uniref:Putative Type II secretion system, protein M n=1 Tax=Candidatus Nitrotoga fabula TaxID=2182327 RepID=A0A2X0QS63_9PROT|nr:putative Type II secretion system, protein M [Candidatus Nitrotoga fabula]
MRALDKKESRYLAVALLLLLLAAIIALVWVPVGMLHRHYDEALESMVDHLARYRQLAATRGEVSLALEQVQKRAGRQHFLMDTGPALAAAEIQSVAKSLIDAGGGRLISMQVAPHRDEDGYRRITVNVQFSSRLPGLRKILYAIETVRPYLLLDNISIRSQSKGGSRDAPAGNPELVAQFDVSGYALVADATMEAEKK